VTASDSSAGASLPSVAFHVRRRVEFRDTDAAGIAHFSAFFTWMESAEHEVLRALGIPVVATGASGETLSWPRVSAACDYRSAVRFGDEMTIAVWVAALGRSSVTYAFRFLDGERVVADGRIVAVHCRMEGTGRPVPTELPAAVRARLEQHHPAVT